MARWQILFPLLFCLASCNGGANMLVVDLRTDWAPAAEFDVVRVEVEGVSADDAPVMASADYLAGARVAELPSVSEGTYSVHVALLYRDLVIARRSVRIQHERSSAVTVVISRLCADVDCPDNSCQSGRCVPLECTPETPDACPEDACADPVDCPTPGASCAVAACREGECFHEPAGTCMEVEYCSPERGCLPLPSDAGPTFRSVAQLGGDEPDEATALAVDSAGNVFVSGFFRGSADIGGRTVPSSGQNDIFLTSYDPAGAVRWSQSFGGSSYDTGYGLAADAAGNIYLAGRVQDTVSLGGAGLPGASYDAFVASYDTDGNHRWSTREGGPGDGDLAYAVAVDATGNVYVVGYMEGSGTWGATPLSSMGGFDIFVSSYESDGTPRWALRCGGPGSDFGFGVATDAMGNVYVVGEFSAEMDCGTESISADGSRRAFIASFDSSGGTRWVRASTSSTSGTTSAGAVATDSMGNVFVAGVVGEGADFGFGPSSATGSGAAFVASFSTLGDPRWVALAQVDSTHGGQAIEVHSAGNVLVSGIYGPGATDFGGAPLPEPSSDGILVASLSSDGTHVWSVGLPSTLAGVGAIRASDTSIYVTGFFQEFLDIQGSRTLARGTDDWSDGFVVRFDR